MSLSFDERASDSPFVERIWRSYSDRAGSFTSIAAPHWEMVVTKYQGKSTLTVRGPETKATPMDYPAEAEWFGIDFKLGAFMPHLPPGHVMDLNDVNLPEATSQSFWLHGSAWQFPTFENADTFVGLLVREGLLVRDSVVDAVIQGHPHELAIRAVQCRFLRATGLSHKAIQQIKRVRHAAALLGKGVPILDTVCEAGYFDQSHLTNSLKRFIGFTPTRFNGTQIISFLSKSE